MKIFFDTNVILDVVQHREDEIFVKKVIESAQSAKSIRIYASYLSIANLAFVLRRSNMALIKNCIRSVMKWCNVSPCNDMQICGAISNDSPDYEDSLQIMCAEANQCDVILTRNPDHFKLFTDIPVLTPREFLSHFANFSSSALELSADNGK